MSVKFQHQTANRLERHAMLPGKEVISHNLFGFLLTSGKNKFPDFGQYTECLRTIVAMRTTAPDSLLIQLYLFVNHSAIDHGAQT